MYTRIHMSIKGKITIDVMKRLQCTILVEYIKRAKGNVVRNRVYVIH